MTARIKNSVNRFALILLSAAIFGIAGCATPNPLVGWRIEFKKVDPAVEKDAEDYIRKLPPAEKKYAGWGFYYKDGTGQHAMVIEVDLNGTAWNHVLVYDKDDKRIKVVKYVAFHYRS
jgi:hypothetical protein